MLNPKLVFGLITIMFITTIILSTTACTTPKVKECPKLICPVEETKPKEVTKEVVVFKEKPIYKTKEIITRCKLSSITIARRLPDFDIEGKNEKEALIYLAKYSTTAKAIITKIIKEYDQCPQPLKP